MLRKQLVVDVLQNEVALDRVTPDTNTEYLFFSGIVSGFAVLMVAVGLWDYPWTMWLNEHRVFFLTQFMDQSIFEEDPLGGSDFGVMLAIFSLVMYLLTSLRPGKNRITSIRPYWGFILTSCIFVGFYMVHGLKLLVARARPGDVLAGKELFTGWYEFGSHFIGNGMFNGSMPSGHTSTVLFYMTIAYILTGYRSFGLKTRIAGICWGVLTFACVLIMAISRAMMLNHWIGDTFVSIGLGWIIIHALYFWVLNVPQQIEFKRRYGIQANMPKLWELRFCLYCLPLVAGAIIVVSGLRSIWIGDAQWLAALAIPVVMVMLFFFRKIRNLLAKVSVALLPTNSLHPDRNAINRTL